MSTKTGTTTRIIACGVFKPAIDHLRLTKKYPNLRLTYLPSVLHTRPQMLEKYLLRKIVSAKKRNERIICLYGDCFPGINDFCQQHGVVKVPGQFCYEMLLGPARFNQLMDETTGTYFLEKDLLVNFREYCMEPLELHDAEMRSCYFEHYEKLLYIRQPTDPDLISQATQLAEFLDLSLAISDVDYSHLESMLDDLL